MDYKTKQMGLMHMMCWKEINLLKINLDKLIQDSERCQNMLSEFISAEESTNMFSLIVFDRYMTQMLTALNMARKYNIHLEINNLDQSVLNASYSGCLDDSNFSQTRVLKDFIEWRKSLFETDLGYNTEINAVAGRIKMAEHVTESNEANLFDKCHIMMKSLELAGKNNQAPKNYATDKTDDVINKVNSMLNILLPIKSLREFKTGFEFQAYMVYVRDYTKLEFFICLNEDHRTLYDLSNNINFRPISHEHLPLDDVFCIVEKKESSDRECLWRAVVVPEERVEFQKLIYLVDFGDVLPLTDNCKTYVAPLRYRQIPPLAIRCIMEGIEDSSNNCFKDHDKCKQALLENEFAKVNFRVLHQRDRVLHVIMIESAKPNENNIPIKNNEHTNPFLNHTTLDNERDSCTNSDDALQLPKSFIYDSPLLSIPFKTGDKIQVIVTHVVSPISFYGIVQNDYYNDNNTFSWQDRQIFPMQKNMLAPPQLNDIVLALYSKDGYWYRAKVINNDSAAGFYKVFYVDFGNTEVVPLSGLAKCSTEQLKDPLRAVLFHISNLSIVLDEQNALSSEKTQLNSVLENVVVMILDQIINLEIVERRNDDLVVRLIDPQYADIPKKLVEMGVAEEI